MDYRRCNLSEKEKKKLVRYRNANDFYIENDFWKQTAKKCARLKWLLCDSQKAKEKKNKRRNIFEPVNAWAIHSLLRDIERPSECAVRSYQLVTNEISYYLF